MTIQTVTPGTPLSITLAQGSFLNVTVPANATAVIYRTGADGTPVIESIVGGPVKTKVGPHLDQRTHVIDARGLACTVEDTVDGGGSSGGVPAYAYNWKLSNTRNFRRSIDLASRPLEAAFTPLLLSMAVIGDSTTFGTNAGAGASRPATADNMRMSFPRRLSDQLAKDLYSTGSFINQNAFFGLRTRTEGDNRRPAATPAGIVSGDVCPGGATIKWPSAGDVTALYSIQTLEAFEVVDIWYKRTASTGSFTFAIDGGAVISTVPTNGAVGYGKFTTPAVSNATHAIDLARVTGTGDVEITHIIPRSSTNRELIMLNLGSPGWSTADWNVTTNAWSPLSGLDLITANTQLNTFGIIVRLGINNLVLGTYSTFVSDMRAILTRLKGYGYTDIMLEISHPLAVQGLVTNANQVQMARDTYALADEFDLPLIDSQKMWCPTPTTSGVALTEVELAAARLMLTTYGYHSDSLHNKAPYHTRDAQAVAQVFRAFV